MVKAYQSATIWRSNFPKTGIAGFSAFRSARGLATIRKGLHMTQARFSDVFGFSLDAVRVSHCDSKESESCHFGTVR
jgi:hypothetical protein